MASGIETSFGIAPYMSGLLFAALMAFVIVGGVRRIAAVAATLATMGVLYALVPSRLFFLTLIR